KRRAVESQRGRGRGREPGRCALASGVDRRHPQADEGRKIRRGRAGNRQVQEALPGLRDAGRPAIDIKEDIVPRIIRSAVLILLFAPVLAFAAVPCADVQKALGSALADVSCSASTALTTANTQTTPADNSIPGLAPGAFTPSTDRTVIAPSAGKRTPIT